VEQLQFDTTQRTNFIPTHYNNVQKIQAQDYVQKRIDYGQLMGYFKKALNCLLADNDQNNLDNIILVYISEKQAKQETDV